MCMCHAQQSHTAVISTVRSRDTRHEIHHEKPLASQHHVYSMSMYLFHAPCSCSCPCRMHLIYVVSCIQGAPQHMCPHTRRRYKHSHISIGHKSVMHTLFQQQSGELVWSGITLLSVLRITLRVGDHLSFVRVQRTECPCHITCL